MGTASTGSFKTTVRQAVIVFSISVLYLLLSIWLVGFKTDQLVLIGIFNTLFFASSITRKFIIGFSIFVVYWIIFDYMKAFPNYNYNTVHIADLYNFEKHIFGININGSVLTPNEYWRANGNSFLDVMGGLFYLCWIPVPLGFAAWLFFFKDRKHFLYLSLSFFIVNILGFIVYYFYPAAPPWYVEYHGFIFHAHTPGNPAGLVKFDQYFHTGVFKSIYAKGSNVFAAMPSLHSSYPVIVLYYGIKNRLGMANIFFAIVALGIWFTAIYASHHYVVDVLAGITTATVGIILFNLLINKTKFFAKFIDYYDKAIQ